MGQYVIIDFFPLFRNGSITSGPLLLFWFSDVVVNSILARTKWLQYFSDYSSVEWNPAEYETLLFITTMLRLLGSSIILFFNFWADNPTDIYSKYSEKPCPVTSSSYFNKLVYSWVAPFIWKGYRSPLKAEDMWKVVPDLSSKTVVGNFGKYFALAYSQKKVKLITRSHHFKRSEKIELQKLDDEKHEISVVSILSALIKTFKLPFCIGGSLKLSSELVNLFTPQIMKMMIEFVKSYGTELQEEQWKGFFYGIILFITLCLRSLLQSKYFECITMMSLQVRVALISALYRKSLVISSSSKKESTVGEIVNLMAVDAQRVGDIVWYLHLAWSSFITIGISVYFMYKELGYAAFVGVSILIITIPLNAKIASVSKKFQLDVMKEKDKRMKMMNEILQGIKVLKLYAWEPSFIQQVLDIRKQEVNVMKKQAYYSAFLAFFWTTAPFLVGLGAFTSFLFIGVQGDYELTASRVFVTLAYLNAIRIPMGMFPMVIVNMIQAKVSLERIEKFMKSKELNLKMIKTEHKKDVAVSIKNGSFRWGSDEPLVLSDINLSLMKGTLTAVVGSVGAGKSSLISTLLGELEKDSGTITMVGNVAFVPQQPWIQNSTLKKNIVFGAGEDEEMYENVIKDCALQQDLEILSAGDATEIGEKGINLSGGQKQRVSLARAVFRKADVYPLDDPLSAVDSHVGKHIFDHVVGPAGCLQGTTRILVTHSITFLPYVDHIIVLKNGKISEQGNYAELKEKKGEFSEFLQEYMGEEETENVSKVKKRGSVSSTSSYGSMSKSESSEDKEEDQNKTNTDKNQKGKLIEKEVEETGRVDKSVYLHYMKAVGVSGAVAAVLSQIIYASSNVIGSYWLSWWTSNKFGNSSEPGTRNMYLGVYTGLGIVQAVFIMINSLIFSLATLKGSKILHKNMLRRIMMSPMAFFDTTPLGRIINRFSKDVDVCDNTLPMTMRSWLIQVLSFLSTMALIVSVIPIFLLITIPVALVFWFIQLLYVTCSRQLRRLESIARSPIYSHFGESITGASTIRAFGKENQFILDSQEKVDHLMACSYPNIMANRWLAIRLEFIANMITFAVAMIAINEHDSIDEGQVGLVISYSLMVTQTLIWVVRQTADLETNIVSVERIKEYSQVEQEAPWVKEIEKPAKDWPAIGHVDIESYGLRYRKDLELVIENISCNISGGEKVGIVGRTGAGKSTLTSALFRIVEGAEGKITIDGVDISKIGLHDLRSKLTIIPQDPVLFSGSIRLNLDPFNFFPDEMLWKAVDQAHLKSFISKLKNGLEYEVSEGGENLSVGQRQLICLARALLRKTKVLVLDEATAAVDLETDALIQSTIRKEFHNCTILTIAHRLNTIMDYDKIMVLESGHLVEFDSPSNLLKDKKTIFYSMARDAKLIHTERL